MPDSFPKTALFRRRWQSLIFLVPLLAAACAAPAAGVDLGNDKPAAIATPFEWTATGDLDAVLATPDLGASKQRFALVLSDQTGLVRFPVVQFTSYRYPDGFDGVREGPVETVLARFTEFPFGTRGLHSTELNFGSPGDWGVEASVPRPDGTTAIVTVRFSVADSPRSVDTGEPAPASKSRTLDDVDNVRDLTTGSIHDEELYRYSIADALRRDRPLVVVFASPAFCTNAVCGPQVKVVSELRERYGEMADFIHVDLYENPQEIQGDLNSAIETPLLKEWGLASQEWTYVVGADGIVTARFENFVGKQELEIAIEKAISQS